MFRGESDYFVLENRTLKFFLKIGAEFTGWVGFRKLWIVGVFQARGNSVKHRHKNLVANDLI